MIRRIHDVVAPYFALVKLPGARTFRYSLIIDKAPVMIRELPERPEVGIRLTPDPLALAGIYGETAKPPVNTTVEYLHHPEDDKKFLMEWHVANQTKLGAKLGWKKLNESMTDFTDADRLRQRAASMKHSEFVDLCLDVVGPKVNPFGDPGKRSPASPGEVADLLILHADDLTQARQVIEIPEAAIKSSTLELGNYLNRMCSSNNEIGRISDLVIKTRSFLPYSKQQAQLDATRIANSMFLSGDAILLSAPEPKLEAKLYMHHPDVVSMNMKGFGRNMTQRHISGLEYVLPDIEVPLTDMYKAEEALTFLRQNYGNQERSPQDSAVYLDPDALFHHPKLAFRNLVDIEISDKAKIALQDEPIRTLCPKDFVFNEQRDASNFISSNCLQSVSSCIRHHMEKIAENPELSLQELFVPEFRGLNIDLYSNKLNLSDDEKDHLAGELKSQMVRYTIAFDLLFEQSRNRDPNWEASAFEMDEALKAMGSALGATLQKLTPNKLPCAMSESILHKMSYWCKVYIPQARLPIRMALGLPVCAPSNPAPSLEIENDRRGASQLNVSR